MPFYCLCLLSNEQPLEEFLNMLRTRRTEGEFISKGLLHTYNVQHMQQSERETWAYSYDRTRSLMKALVEGLL